VVLRLDASGTGSRSLAVFARLTAVFVGLANLTFLAVQNGVGAAIQRGDATWNNAFPVVLAVIVAGLLISEIVLRRFTLLGEEFSQRYLIVVLAWGLGGALTGGLVAAALALNGALVIGSATLLERIAAAIVSALVGAGAGGVLGVAEGLLLALPLAAILGLFRRTS